MWKNALWLKRKQTKKKKQQPKPTEIHPLHVFCGVFEHIQPPHLQVTKLLFIWNISNNVIAVKLHVNSELLYSQIARVQVWDCIFEIMVLDGT